VREYCPKYKYFFGVQAKRDFLPLHATRTEKGKREEREKRKRKKEREGRKRRGQKEERNDSFCMESVLQIKGAH
jgi:hypothetical protein